jgi:hypothetical protein
VSEREMLEDHPLELARLKQAEEAAKSSPAPTPGPKPDASPDKPGA